MTPAPGIRRGGQSPSIISRETRAPAELHPSRKARQPNSVTQLQRYNAITL